MSQPTYTVTEAVIADGRVLDDRELGVMTRAELEALLLVGEPGGGRKVTDDVYEVVSKSGETVQYQLD